MEEKPNYYAVIPAKVRYDLDLKDKAKLLYGEISALCNMYGYCDAGNKYFSNLYEVDTSTISRLLKNLSDKGYIKTSLKYKNNSKEIEKRYIYITEGYMQNCIEGICKKVKENNKEEEEYIGESIFEYIEKNLGRVLSPIEFEIISSWDYEDEIIKLAVKEAILHNAKTIKYIDRIIFNWKQNKVETLEDATKYLDEFSNKYKNTKEEKEVVNYYKNLDE